MRAFLSAILTVVLALFVSHQTLAQTRLVWTNGTGNWDATTQVDQ